MISINFTLWVQLALFLAFMWALNRVLFRPLLMLLDERKAASQRNKQAAQDLGREVMEREMELVSRILDLRRQANLEFTQARWSAVEKNNAELSAMRKAADAEIEETRDSYRTAIRAERGAFPELADGIGNELAQKLGLE